MKQRMQSSSCCSISVFTGFLGAGKTTLITSLVSQLKARHPEYKVVILKNEIGQVDVDTELITSGGGDEAQPEALKLTEKSTATSSSAPSVYTAATAATTTTTMTLLNGCLCCTLVGSLKDALIELQQLHRPDRIIIESKGYCKNEIFKYIRLNLFIFYLSFRFCFPCSHCAAHS